MCNSVFYANVQLRFPLLCAAPVHPLPSRCTGIAWVPGTKGQFVTAHADGNLYVYEQVSGGVCPWSSECPLHSSVMSIAVSLWGWITVWLVCRCVTLSLCYVTVTVQGKEASGEVVFPALKDPSTITVSHAKSSKVRKCSGTVTGLLSSALSCLSTASAKVVAFTTGAWATGHRDWQRLL